MKPQDEPIHIKVEKKSDIAPLVLMPGDPLRAKYIAEKFLDNAKLVTSVRNMFGFTGTYKGKKVTIMGSGMGMPSMSIYAFELFYYFGVEKIIRIGTCGVVTKDIKVPELILADSVYSLSNFAYNYDGYDKNMEYPSKTLNNGIIKTAAEFVNVDLKIVLLPQRIINGSAAAKGNLSFVLGIGGAQYHGFFRMPKLDKQRN